MTLITIQPGNTTTGEYDVHKPLPYPYHVDAATGDVDRQDFFKGTPAAVIGFQDDADVQVVDLLWKDAAADPDRIVGKFPVLVDSNGNIYSLTVPITSTYVTEGESSEVP